VNRVAARLSALRLAPDGRPRPEAPFGRGPLAARVLRVALESGTAIGSRLPPALAQGLAVAGGTVEWAVRPRKRRTLAENLAHALELPPSDPRVRRLVRQEVLNEARRSADLLWALGKPDELVRTTVVEGAEHAYEALARGNGLLLASAHLGGWEVATALPRALVPVRTTAIVTDDWIAWAADAARARAGIGRLYDSEPVARAARKLRDGEAVLVLADYAKSSMRTYPVRLLDAVAELPAGVVTLARLCGAPIVPFAVLPLGPRRWRVVVEPALLPPPRRSRRTGDHELLQRLADRWTAQLREHPEHWAAVYPIAWTPAEAGVVGSEPAAPAEQRELHDGCRDNQAE
jgi:KDO2-lipid IV(A) lauroyltransferase